MGSLNIDAFVLQLRKQALPPYGDRSCARFVRLALEAGGASTFGHPRDARDGGPTLNRIGFKTLVVTDPETFQPIKGDVAVIHSTSHNTSGHMQSYDGTHWISDFIQPGPSFWPGPAYRKEKPGVVIHRP